MTDAPAFSPLDIDKQRIKDTLGSLLSFYNISADIHGLISQTPIKQNEGALHYIMRLLEVFGFAGGIKNVDRLNASELQTPVVIIDSNDIALIMPAKIFGSERNVFTHDEALGDKITAGKFSGLALFLRKQDGTAAGLTDHMHKGHALDWFWEPIAKYWTSYKEIILCSVFINLLVLSIPLFSLNVYDRVIINFAEETLLVLTIGVSLALAFDFLFKTVRSYILDRVAENMGSEFDFKLMERLMRIKTSHMAMSIGEQANMFRELHGIREFYAGRLVPTIVDFPFICLFIFVIYLLCPPLALVPVSVTIILLFINILAHIPIGRMTAEFFETMQSKSGFLIETLAGMSTIRMFGANSNRLFQWDTNVAKSARITRHNQFAMNLMANLTFMISQICHVMIVFFGAYQIQEGNLTIGGLITCTILSGRAIAPVMNLSSLLARLQQSNDVLKAIDKFFKLPHEDLNEVTKTPKGPFRGSVDILNASFQYATQMRPALKGVGLNIKSGEHIGLIGKTAAGKSTLAKMIAGFLEPQEGEIKLDGFDYKTIPHTELRRSVSYAPQDSFFFRGSVLYNITLGRDDIHERDLQDAIEISGLQLVMSQTAEGLDMDVGEQGSRLSGGQKQAITLARAIARRPQVLIFDEPTTGMDNALENHVKARLKNYVADKTFIMITHRTTLLPLVNRLVLVDAGKIVADGPRDEILQKLTGQQ